jgi:cytochrome c556
VKRSLLIAVWALCAGTAGLAQVVFTLDDLDRAMKTVGRNIDLAKQAIAAKDFETAKVRVTRAREQLSPTLAFWRNEKQSDAQKMVRAATARLDDLDSALSASPVDPGKVATAAAGVDAGCQACHTMYREEDPVTKTFRPILKRESGTTR